MFGREPGTLRNLYASGGVGFLHDMLDVAGATNVFAAEKRESVQASSETLLALAPEVMIELHVESDGPVDLSAWQTLPALPAARNHRIVVLTGTDLGDGRSARRESDRTARTGAPSGGVLVDRQLAADTITKARRHEGAKVNLESDGQPIFVSRRRRASRHRSTVVSSWL